MFNQIFKTRYPEILLITPLRIKDDISLLTERSIIKNNTSFDWISYSSDNNPIINCERAIEEYKKRNMVPKYIMKLDNDINADPGWLDSMYNALEQSNNNIAYAYTSFEYYGHINIKFPVRDFDVKDLVKRNYISFNSLIKYNAFLNINGFVHLYGQDRLWDWALWLKFLKHNYTGMPVYEKHFKAFASESSISCGSSSNYYKNYNLIKNSYLFD